MTKCAMIVFLSIFAMSSFSASREVFLEKNGIITKLSFDDVFSKTDIRLSNKADSIFVALKMSFYCHDYNVTIVNDTTKISNCIGLTSNHCYSSTTASEPLAIVLFYRTTQNNGALTEIGKFNKTLDRVFFETEQAGVLPAGY